MIPALPPEIKVDNVPIMGLQLRFADGSTFGVLSERDVAELEWAATALRQALPSPV